MREHRRNTLQVVTPPNLIAAAKEAAARQLTTTSEYTRRALIEKLCADGIDPRQFATAGASVAA